MAYPIGLSHTHGAPQLAVLGLDVHAVHHMLDRLGAESATGAEPADGQRHPEVVDGHQVAWPDVADRFHR
ncbi:DUF4262 domain-containing protein [Streptomyces fuscichromogenes]|uniref:DUF4262 domain-containing protein n=1 Tax=Streptomyces fuscichromogenes TaxID=1324013 RepID=UPI00166FCEBB|nr:DUF4262 domain-containing protein [Streptomyces fuscichromogenes]